MSQPTIFIAPAEAIPGPPRHLGNGRARDLVRFAQAEAAGPCHPRASERALTAIVVWVHFELPPEGPQYRAGIEFVASAGEIVEGFISTISE